MILKISVCAMASFILMQSLPAEAAAAGEQEKYTPATKPADLAPQIQKAPAIRAPAAKMPARMIDRPGFKMTCPEANEVTLHISYVSTSWALNPTQVQPGAFARAYAQIDPSDKSKVTLACLYQVTADYVAKTSYNGLQKCYCNPTTGEGMVKYTGPSGFTTNVAGTSAKGNLPVKKTGEQIQNEMLECQFHLDGQAQLFKEYPAPGNLSSCEASGKEVTCRY